MVIVSVSINIPRHTIEVVGDTNFLLFNRLKIEKQGGF